MAAGTQTPQRQEQPLSGWAASGVAFAGTMLMLIGSFQVIAGLTAIFNDEFFVVAPNYTFDLDTSAWGWLHLLLGAAMVTTGLGLFGGRTWARAAAIVFASLSALMNFFFIPYYPFWSVLVIALDVWVIWAVTRPGALDMR